MSKTEHDYPFHTDMLDGKERTMIAFNFKNKKFYEFQDPDSHDHYAQWICPRDGHTINHKTIVNYVMGCGMALDRSMVVADEWAAFREGYVESDDQALENAAAFIDAQIDGTQENDVVDIEIES